MPSYTSNQKKIVALNLASLYPRSPPNDIVGICDSFQMITLEFTIRQHCTWNRGEMRYLAEFFIYCLNTCGQDLGIRWGIDGNLWRYYELIYHSDYTYLVIDIFPKVHSEELKWHNKGPSHVIKICVAIIWVWACICQTCVVHWTRPMKSHITYAQGYILTPPTKHTFAGNSLISSERNGLFISTWDITRLGKLG